ncbi:MAG: imidazole glycerol phosphate synthase subunit HisH [Flavobacteriaceae bacterium TMED171]|nr:imidazole glycerol phosphate synthase subunit HisH [Flavobacteriaceae bacterium]OUW31804.1 MAG: imidazole glycerol phosphate synthase subunit HisH [Flavobacteriaceae bacterium TMED171]|tara:strand:- start:1385 stop:1966 length:582 start_codon:yes stop_codon:yes gene_type:complete
MKTVIVDYNAGNVKSLQFALERLGVDAQITYDSEMISVADKVIFPGQGEAASAMGKLKSKGLDILIPQLKQPVLGICLGMQLMCKETEEGNTQGLDILPVKVTRFPDTVKVPQMGWNTVSHSKKILFEGITQDCYMYLVHSYYVPLNDATTAQSSYAGTYSVAVQKDNFFGVQFHPEKSSKDGLKLLDNFLNF